MEINFNTADNIDFTIDVGWVQPEGGGGIIKEPPDVLNTSITAFSGTAETMSEAIPAKGVKLFTTALPAGINEHSSGSFTVNEEAIVLLVIAGIAPVKTEDMVGWEHVVSSSIDSRNVGNGFTVLKKRCSPGTHYVWVEKTTASDSAAYEAPYNFPVDGGGSETSRASDGAPAGFDPPRPTSFGTHAHRVPCTMVVLYGARDVTVKDARTITMRGYQPPAVDGKRNVYVMSGLYHFSGYPIVAANQYDETPENPKLLSLPDNEKPDDNPYVWVRYDPNETITPYFSYIFDNDWYNSRDDIVSACTLEVTEEGDV